LLSFKALLAAAAISALAIVPAQARTVLFLGSSFTYGAHSAAQHYHPELVKDLNGPNKYGETYAGVPAIFKQFTLEAGLNDYDVSSELVGGKGLEYWFTVPDILARINRPWDVVVMHGFSTLDQAHPGDPALLVSSAKQITDMFRARNPNSQIWLDATWSRADQTYPDGKPWHGKRVQQMGIDLAGAYALAAKNAHVTGVVPLGLAWNRAIDTGVAGDNPYTGIPSGKIDLWSWDNYHASAHGYYLEALMVFGRVTGRDPQSLGDSESVAEDMGFSKPQTHALQQIAHDQLAASNMLGQ
jgi:hypothetical protein